jgi:MtrB/PioB family decaheme-associated outer membrane protein
MEAREMSMKANQTYRLFRRSCLASLVAGLFGHVHAQAQDPLAERRPAIDAATAVSSELNVGVAAVSADNRRFGQYNGMRDAGPYPIFDMNVVTLDKDTGTWTRFSGRNLGLDTGEMMLDLQRQGQWRYFIGYSQGVRYEPYVVNTGLTGIGTTSVTVNGTAIRPVDLKMTRDQYNAGFDQTFAGNNGFRVRYSFEDKQGARLYGHGATGATAPSSIPPPAPTGTAMEFLAEPINRTTQTLEASLSHTGRDFQVSGGYYGTLFFNHADRLDVQNPNCAYTGSIGTGCASTNAAAPGYPLYNTVNGVPAFTPMSMPLSNNSHQLFVNGGYNLSPLTRLTFKAARTVAQQNETLIDVAPGATLSGAPRSLHGRVDTKLGYLDLTSLEADRLDLQVNVRYEDRDDKTPLAQYLTDSTQLTIAGNRSPSQILAGMNGYNKPRSWSTLKLKFEAGLQLPMAFKAVGSFESEGQTRNVPEPYRRVGFRESNDELTTRFELKRMIAESLNGSVSYARAKRTGSDYVSDTYDMNGAAAGAPPSALVNALLWADRDRDTWKASVDWVPLDELALHLAFDRSEDQYSGKLLGPRGGQRDYVSLDASYNLTERWQANLWVSRDDTRAEQATQTGSCGAACTSSNAQRWQSKLRQVGDAVGGGVRGKLKRGIDLGADLAHHRERAEQRMSGTFPATVGSTTEIVQVNSLPDYEYKLTEVKLFASYALDPSSGVRLDYIYQNWRTDDWTWLGWTYTDGATLTQDAQQRVHYVAASYYLRWR